MAILDQEPNFELFGPSCRIANLNSELRSNVKIRLNLYSYWTVRRFDSRKPALVHAGFLGIDLNLKVLEEKV